MTKFKVGDVLRKLPGNYCERCFTPGKTYTVLFYDEKSISFVETNEGKEEEKYETQGRFSNFENQFELVDKSHEARLERFKANRETIYQDAEGKEISKEQYLYMEERNKLIFGDSFSEVIQSSESITFKLQSPAKMIRCSTPLGENPIYQQYTEENKMEIKNMKKENITEAKKKYDEERNNEEVKSALEQLNAAQNAIDRLDRDINAWEEQKKPHLEVIKLFKGK